MNSLVEELKSQTSSKTFLLKYLEYLTEYFKKAAHLSQERTYLRIKNITDKMLVYFPLNYWLRNITNKLIGNVKEKVDDKFQTSEDHQIDLHHFIINLNRTTSDAEGGRNIDEGWLRKLLVEEIANLRDDINQSQDFLVNHLRQKIVPKFNVVFLDSFNNNSNMVERICKQRNASLKHISPTSLKDGARQVKNANLLIVSAESVMKNGGVLVQSGGLMLIAAASTYNIPVLVITEGFCLTENFIIGQALLGNKQNPLSYFESEEKSEMKVYIGKKYDYIEPSLISQLVNEEGCWSTENATQMFGRYYN